MSREGTKGTVRDSNSTPQSLLTLLKVHKIWILCNFLNRFDVPKSQKCGKCPTSFHAYLPASAWNCANEGAMVK